MRAHAAWLPVLLYTGLIAAASSIPARAVPPGGDWGLDKIVHGVEYAVLGALWARALHHRTGFSQLAVATLALAAAALTGACDELYQHLTPGRYPSAADVVADALGGALGATLATQALTRSKEENHGPHP